MELFNLKDKINFLEEVAELEYDEWADNKKENRKNSYKESNSKKSWKQIKKLNN